jgi:hypothetical protein
MGDITDTHRILVIKPEGKRPIGIYGRRWKDNIKTDLTEIGFEDMVWIYLVQDRERRLALVKMVMNLRIP